MGIELSRRRDILYNANLTQDSKRLCNLAKLMQLVGVRASSKGTILGISSIGGFNINHRRSATAIRT